MNRGSASDKYLAIGLVFAIIGMVGMVAVGGTLLARHERRHTYEDPPSVEVVTSNPTVSLPENLQAHDDPSADDGELHDARVAVEGYSFREGVWALADTAVLPAYDMTVACDFMVRYPQISGNLPQVDAINEILRSAAMQTVHTFYEDPSAETIKRVRELADSSSFFVPEDADAILYSDVSYAISYNDERLLSVCFNDEYYMATEALGFVALRTVNVDLQTGECYTLDDILTLDESIATSFVDNLVRASGEDANGDGIVQDDECFEVTLVGRDVLVKALQGSGDLAPERLRTCLFVDANGKPNLGVTYWLSGENGFVRGWWDVTITDEQVAAARRDSAFWELLGMEPA